MYQYEQFNVKCFKTRSNRSRMCCDVSNPQHPALVIIPYDFIY